MELGFVRRRFHIVRKKRGEAPDHRLGVVTNRLDALGGSSLFKRFE